MSAELEQQRDFTCGWREKFYETEKKSFIISLSEILL